MIKAIQKYHIHMKNGEVVEVLEDYDLPFHKGLVASFQNARDNDVLQIKSFIDEHLYIPKKNISFIRTGDVEEVNNGDKD